MFDTDPTTETLLETSLTSTTSESPINVETTTKVIILDSNTDARATNDKDSTDDYDESIQIPPGMFDTDPIFERVVATVATNVTSASPIKAKPTTKPTSTCIEHI